MLVSPLYRQPVVFTVPGQSGDDTYSRAIRIRGDQHCLESLYLGHGAQLSTAPPTPPHNLAILHLSNLKSMDFVVPATYLPHQLIEPLLKACIEREWLLQALEIYPTTDATMGIRICSAARCKRYES